MKVEDNDMSHDNDNSCLDNDNNKEVSYYNMYSLVKSSNYSSCYSNVASTHSDYNSTLAYRNLSAHANFEKILLLVHNKQTF